MSDVERELVHFMRNTLFPERQHYQELYETTSAEDPKHRECQEMLTFLDLEINDYNKRLKNHEKFERDMYPLRLGYQFYSGNCLFLLYAQISLLFLFG